MNKFEVKLSDGAYKTIEANSWDVSTNGVLSFWRHHDKSGGRVSHVFAPGHWLSVEDVTDAH
jgi:hypothetical protein